VIKPAKPELTLALGGPKVAADYREWAEPMLGGESYIYIYIYL